MAKKMEVSKPDVESSEDRLKSLEEQLRRYEERDAEIAKFTAVISEQESQIQAAISKVSDAKAAYEEAKDELAELKEVFEGVNRNFVLFFSPKDRLPLFDRMEAADDAAHGQNSAVWRNEPVVSAGISLPSVLALTDANLALIGCLQDRVLKSPDSWWADVPGLNSESAKRVVERLNDFIFKKTQE